MLAAIEFDPAVHKLRPLPIQESLRRETKNPTIITYWHDGTKKWLVAMQSLDGRHLLEIDYVDGVEGHGTIPTRDQFQRIVKLLTVFTPKKERRAELGSWAREMARQDQDANERQVDNYKALYRWLNRNKGQQYAERYARHVGLDMGPSVLAGT